MRSLIANKLTYIWKEIKTQLPEKEQVNHSEKNELFRQRVFLLKNYPAHLHEYYEGAKKLTQSNQLKEPFHILSIGCGCGIDYDAFFAAASEANFESFTYTGIEEELWYDQNGIPPNQLTWIWSKLSKLNELELASINIIQFPKSLKQMPYKEFEALKTLIQTGRPQQEKLCLAFSATDPSGISFELNRFETVIQLFRRWHKYRQIHEDILQINHENTINDDRFEYPPKIFSYLSGKIPRDELPVKHLKTAYMKFVYLSKK